jgi:hypothetical protein
VDELRTAAFLTRTPGGHYGFSHKSFLEFYARHIAGALAWTPGAALATRAAAPARAAATRLVRGHSVFAGLLPAKDGVVLRGGDSRVARAAVRRARGEMRCGSQTG